MRTRSFIAVAAFLAVLVVLGGVLYAYDHARADEIAPGVKVAGATPARRSPGARFDGAGSGRRAVGRTLGLRRRNSSRSRS